MAVVVLFLTLLSLISCAAGPAPVPERGAGALAPEELRQEARDLVGLLVEGKFGQAHASFAAAMAQALPAAELETVWAGLLSTMGHLTGVGDSRFVEEGGFQVVYVTCHFAGGSLDVKVVFDRSGKVAGLWFVESKPGGSWQVPPYADADSFTEMECSIGEGDWMLPATLTMPKGEGPFPAVVLIHGSGPQDRDETLGPNKPFRDLAWGLASRGVAVLRYEKRTWRYRAECGRLVHANALTVEEEVVGDALAAVAVLPRTQGVDANRVFLLGHSMGAMLAPRIAERVCAGHAPPARRLAGLILLAGNTRSVPDMLIEQTEYLARLDGVVDGQEQARLQALREEVARVKGGTLREGEVVLGACQRYWVDLMRYDPVAVARGLDLPMLILQGERDYQVTMKDFAAWKDALGGRPDARFRSYPDLNHFFVPGTGSSSPSEYQLPGNVAPAVIEDIAGWISTRR